jgi:hypothetical protein
MEDDLTFSNSQVVEAPVTPTTQEGDPGVSGTPNPGRRLKNPLADFASYNYQLSLYMITPDAYDAFVNDGRRNINILNQTGGGAGAYLLCQNGGINSTEKRAAGFEFDYYIDNLQIKSAVSSNSTMSPTVNYEMSFQIIEPYGFSFITNLKLASNQITQYSQTKNIQDLRNGSRQFFVLGIKFLGYDIDGNLMTDIGKTFDRYYDILFTEVQFKLDGRATVYSIKAASIPSSVAMGSKRGTVDKGAPLTGNKVGDLIRSLMAKLNNDQQSLEDTGAISKGCKNNYVVEFRGDASEIENATIVSKADLDKAKWPMTNGKKTSAQVNDRAAVTSKPNSNEREINIEKATPIVQAIGQIISQSSYLTDGLKKVYTTDIEPDPKSDDLAAIENAANKKLRWYNVSAVLTEAKWDPLLKDFAYKITYIIVPYEIPIILSAYADRTTPYYGPAKRYSYWYTGKNSEVIKYEQTLNNAYFTVSLGTDGVSSKSTGGGADVPINTQGKRQSTPRQGKLDVGYEAQNSVTTSLYEPGSWATAKIEIMGDPDWLAGEPSGDPTLYTPFQGTDFRIDFYSGQVFIEIDFKEALDYVHSTGTLRINEDLLFWDYPPEIKKKVEGVSYRVINIVHTFRNGKFTQELTCAINTFGFDQGYTGSSRETSETAKSQENQTDAETRRLASKTPVGLVQDQPPPTNNLVGAQANPAGNVSLNNQQTISSNNGPVVNDDSNLGKTSTALTTGAGRE